MLSVATSAACATGTAFSLLAVHAADVPFGNVWNSSVFVPCKLVGMFGLATNTLAQSSCINIWLNRYETLKLSELWLNYCLSCKISCCLILDQASLHAILKICCNILDYTIKAKVFAETLTSPLALEITFISIDYNHALKRIKSFNVQ